MIDARRDRERLGLWAVATAIAALWLWIAVPLALGRETLCFRDVFGNNLPVKAFGAAELMAGRVPAFDPTAGLGQPFRGNPAALAFYPDNLLYRLLPFWRAFNLHFVLHWGLAGLGMLALLRARGRSPAAALAGAVTYAGCGWFLGALTFYNLVTVAAWWPWVLLGAERGDRRGMALGGVALGFALLGGEPVTALLGVLPLALILRRHGVRRALAVGATIVGIGLVVALPQIVATARIVGFTARAGEGVVGSYALHLGRLVELVVPLPLGRPTWVGPHGFWGTALAPRGPLFLSLYFGIVGLYLAAIGARRARGAAALTLGGILIGVAGGWAGPALTTVSAGLLRYPEKALFWTALGAALLVAAGTEEVLDGERRRGLGPGLAAGLCLAAAAAAVLLRAILLDQARDAAARTMLGVQAGGAALALGLAALLLALAALAARRRAGAALVALQVAGLLQLGPLLLRDEVGPYREPAEWVKLVPGFAVHDVALSQPPWGPAPSYRVAGPRSLLLRAQAADLAPAPGVRFGLSDPLRPDSEGMGTPLQALVLARVSNAPWAARVRWLRALGVDAIVTHEELAVDGLTEIAQAERLGVTSHLLAVEHPAPAAWWPDRVVFAADPTAATAVVEQGPDPIASPALSAPVEQRPGGVVEVLRMEPDAIDLETRGPGGVVVVRRAYHRLWRASAEGQPLPIRIADLALLAVEVPAGEHRVELRVSDRPEQVASILAALGLVGAAWLAARQ